jgi:hypothetical protein
MFNTIVGAGAASRYGSGSDQKMRLIAGPAPQHWKKDTFHSSKFQIFKNFTQLDDYITERKNVTDEYSMDKKKNEIKALISFAELRLFFFSFFTVLLCILKNATIKILIFMYLKMQV